MDDLGTRVLGLMDGEAAIRAEALRNACIQAAFHGGADTESMNGRFATIDLTRPSTSAFTGGIERDEMPDDRADRVAALWRELALLTRRLAEVRTYGSGPKGQLRRLRRIGTRTGVKAADRRLNRLGLLDGEGKMNSTPWDRDAVPLELIEAARDCEADTDPATSRYLVLDRRGQRIPEEEFTELNWLGHRATAEQLGDAIADRRRKLEAAGVRPGTADR
jgi:hypothetical protein